jgi:hypothetical protein
VGVPAFGCGLDAMPRESLRRPAERKFEKRRKKVGRAKKILKPSKNFFLGTIFLFENAE